jgi:hypothetical protein
MRSDLFGRGRRRTAALAAGMAVALGILAVPPMVAQAAAPRSAPGASVATAPCSGYLPTGSVVGIATTPDDGGYWIVNNTGNVVACGDAPSFGSLGVAPTHPIVGIAATPDGAGYYLVASDGGIFTFGDALFRGSTGSLRLNRPVVGMGVDPATGGYWLVASDGGIFSFGAPFRGSTGSLRLNQPVVGMSVDPATGGYWLVASDGGIFSFGAPFRGSTGSLRLNQPVVGMSVDAATGGYRLVASDGGIFTFSASFLGSTGSLRLSRPVVGMESAASGSGYRLVASDGGVFTFGSSRFFGSTVSPFPIGICTATMSNPNPPGGSTETVTIRSTVPNAPIIVTTNSKIKSKTYGGLTNASGGATVAFDIEHPKADYPVGVVVNLGNGSAICFTSFTPR